MILGSFELIILNLLTTEVTPLLKKKKNSSLKLSNWKLQKEYKEFLCILYLAFPNANILYNQSMVIKTGKLILTQ